LPHKHCAMEWFETWFDSEYYHKLYKSRDDKEAERFINNLINNLQLNLESTILDLACGKGRHSIFLNEKGLKTTGVDLSPNSISWANKFKNDNLRFEIRDMRESFCESEFDAIFNLFTSFGYFESKTENVKVLKAIENMLKDNGVFVIDFMNANKVIRNLVREETKSIDHINFLLRRSYENGNIIKTIDFTDKENDFHFTEKVQALFLEDFQYLISQTNLKIDSIFGDYNLNPFDKDISDRLIIVGRKE
jgi:cyclopropane fatty-acyl-phospholipid synthase-like methyltransferase